MGSDLHILGEGHGKPCELGHGNLGELCDSMANNFDLGPERECGRVRRGPRRRVSPKPQPQSYTLTLQSRNPLISDPKSFNRRVPFSLEDQGNGSKSSRKLELGPNSKPSAPTFLLYGIVNRTPTRTWGFMAESRNHQPDTRIREAETRNPKL